MKRISLQKALLGAMCAGVLGYTFIQTAQAQPEPPPPGTASPGTEDPTRTQTPGTRTPGSPTEPVDPTAPPSPSAPSPEPTERAPSAMPAEAEKPLDRADMNQIKTATQKLRAINAAEIAAGELAQENGMSQEVKDYGRMLVEDHQAADKNLVEFATKHDVTLAGSAGSQEATRAGTGTDVGQPPPAALDAEGKKMMSKLRAAKGEKFDKTFASAMVTAHQKALNLIKTSKDKIKNEEFDSMLSDFQSTFGKHLDHAKQLSNDTARSSATTGEDESTRQGRRPTSTPRPSEPSSPSMPSPSTPSPEPTPPTP
jgi:putative membrane protein